MDYIWSEQKKARHYRRDVTLSAPNCPYYRDKEVLKILVQRGGWAQSYLCFEKKTDKPPAGSRRHTKLVTEDISAREIVFQVKFSQRPTLMSWLHLAPHVLAHRSSASSTRFIDSYPKVDMRWGAQSGVNFLNATEISESGIYLSSFSILGGLLKKTQSLAHIKPRSF